MLYEPAEPYAYENWHDAMRKQAFNQYMAHWYLRHKDSFMHTLAVAFQIEASKWFDHACGVREDYELVKHCCWHGERVVYGQVVSRA